MNILHATRSVTEGGRAARRRSSDVPLAIVLAFAFFAFAAIPADAASPLAQLSGSWSGSGNINLADGKSESLKCKAYYTQKDGGAEVGVALRCASTSNKVELRANLVADGSRLSGSWEERTFNASGTVMGEASPTQIKFAINGGGFSGSMVVTTTGTSQVVSVSTASQNRFVQNFYDVISMIFHYHYQWDKADEKKRNRAALHEHLAYIAALRSRDPRAIDAKCRAHLRSARKTLLRSIGT
jgi:FCD domain